MAVNDVFEILMRYKIRHYIFFSLRTPRDRLTHPQGCDHHTLGTAALRDANANVTNEIKVVTEVAEKYYIEMYSNQRAGGWW